MKAEIINIGDELLIGQVVNTNASWMASELSNAGIKVIQITSIADDAVQIKKSLDQAKERADVILISGGLGPTKDDITKKTLAEYFHSELIFHEPTYENVKKIFAARNFNVSEVNKQQALVPDKCIPLLNVNGTAPGMWFEDNGKVIVSMPGVPFEMQALLKEQVIPMLQKKYKMEAIVNKTIMTTGWGESYLAEKIKDWEESLPDYIKLAYLPQPGIVRLRLSGHGDNKEKLKNEIDILIERLKKIIPKVIYGFDEISLEEVVGKLLKEKNKIAGTAESCTGGYLSHLITSIPGSSAYFKGGIISYANEVKIKQLNVVEQSLTKYGAVSRQVVEEMAIGAKKRLGVDYAMAVSGIAGPDGGTDEKPVGTTWIALSGPAGVKSKIFHFGEHRGRNIRRAALAALNMLRITLTAV